MKQKILWKTLGVITAATVPVGALVACNNDDGGGGDKTTNVKAWDKTLPSGPFYETANPNEYTTTIANGKGYVPKTPGKPKTLPPSPNVGDIIDIDKVTYTYQQGTKGFEFYGFDQAKSSWNSKPSSLTKWGKWDLSQWTKALELPAADVTKLKATNGGKNDPNPWLKASVKKIFAKNWYDATFLGNSANPSISYQGSKTPKNVTPQDITSNAFLSSLSIGDEIYLYAGNHSIPESLLLKVATLPDSWDKTLPIGPLYELKGTPAKYTADETKAQGYAPGTTPPTKTVNDLETAAQAVANKQITINGNVYTYLK